MHGLAFGSLGRIRQATGLRIRRAVLRYSIAEFLDAAQPIAAHDRGDIGFLVTACEQPGMKALLTPLKYRRLARSVSLIGADRPAKPREQTAIRGRSCSNIFDSGGPTMHVAGD